MRMPGKALELNFCAQFSERVRPRQTLWFGLTQRQEAQWGFDARADLGGHLAVFLFTAPRKMNERLWRLGVKHRQLCSLRGLVRQSDPERVSIFYAFPLIATDAEFMDHPHLLSRTWLLDVRELREVPAPEPKDETHQVEVRLEEGKPPIAHVATIRRDFPHHSAEEFVQALRDPHVTNSIAGFPKGDLLAEDARGAMQMRLPLSEAVGVLLWPVA
jgi:hypothetical protein